MIQEVMTEMEQARRKSGNMINLIKKLPKRRKILQVLVNIGPRLKVSEARKGIEISQEAEVGRGPSQDPIQNQGRDLYRVPDDDAEEENILDRGLALLQRVLDLDHILEVRALQGVFQRVEAKLKD